MSIFSDRILTLRNHFGLSQEDFAKRIGISQGYLTKAETGKNVFSRKIMNRISNAFGINMPWLEFGEDPMLKKEIPTEREEVRDVVADYSFYSKEEEDELVARVKVVIRSSSSYRKALIENINAFYTAILSERDLQRKLADAERLIDTHNRTPIVESSKKEEGL